MQVIATLSRHRSDTHAPLWQARVSCAVIGTELSRMPWMVARVENGPGAASVASLLADPDTPYRLHVAHSEPDDSTPGVYAARDAAPCMQAADTAWYVSAVRPVLHSTQLVLVLYADPRHRLTRLPFAHDQVTLEALVSARVTDHVDAWHTAGMWRPGFDGSAVFETLVSMGESREQLARRMGAYANAYFSLTPPARPGGSDPFGWTVRWSDSLHRLGETCHRPARWAAAGEVLLDSETLGWEMNMAARAARGARAPSQPYARVFEHPVLVSTSRDRQTTRVPLPSPLHVIWHYTDDPVQTQCWPGSEMDGQHAPIVIAALHVIGTHTQMGTCGEVLSQHLGQPCPPVSASGYACMTVSLPASHAQIPPALLYTLLEDHGIAPLVAPVLRLCGLGHWDLRQPGAHAPGGLLQAVVASSPSAQVVDRGEDNRSYRHQIWVRLAGVDGVLRAHWVTPFASRNQDGTARGDLVLVPEAGSNGYVMLTGGHGMPVFIGTTHFRETTTASALDANGCRHGLVTYDGMRILDNSHINLDAPQIQNTHRQSIRVIGNFPSVPGVSDMLQMDDIPPEYRP